MLTNLSANCSNTSTVGRTDPSAFLYDTPNAWMYLSFFAKCDSSRPMRVARLSVDTPSWSATNRNWDVFSAVPPIVNCNWRV